jgi:hypothetical protein
MTVKNPHEEEILRDLPLLQRRINQCTLSKQEYARNIEKEQLSITELQIFIEQDAGRVQSGKRARYDPESMSANIVRLQDNINLFKDKIKQEDEAIAKLNSITQTLLEDLAKKPNEIVIDMGKKDFYGK